MNKVILYIAEFLIELMDARIKRLEHKKELKELMNVKREELFKNMSKIKELINEEPQQHI